MALKVGTQSELAEILGVNRAAISHAINKGRLVKCLVKEKDKVTGVQLATGVLEWCAETDITKIRFGEVIDDDVNGSIPSFSESKRHKAHFAALNEQLTFEKEAGKLVNVDRVQKQFFEAGRVTRDRIIGVIDEIAAACEEQPAHFIRRFMKQKLTKVLTDLESTKLEV